MPATSSLGIECISDAIVHPTKLIDWAPENMSTGVQTRDGQFLTSANLTRLDQTGNRYEAQRPALAADTKHAIEKGFFAGMLDHRYGHFLLESLGRLYCRDDFPDYPVVWSARCDVAQQGFQIWQSQLLDLLGVKGPHVLVTEPCSVSKLMIAPSGYVIQHEFTQAQQSFLAKVPWRPERGKKTWLSRRNQTRRPVPGMSEFEDTLRTQGWTIIAPETLSVPKQLEVLARSERIAGPIGSALHSLILLKDADGLQVDLFVPEPFGTEARMNQNYVTIARAKGFRQAVHFIPNADYVARQHISMSDVISRLQSCLA